MPAPKDPHPIFPTVSREKVGYVSAKIGKTDVMEFDPDVSKDDIIEQLLPHTTEHTRYSIKPLHFQSRTVVGPGFTLEITEDMLSSYRRKTMQEAHGSTEVDMIRELMSRLDDRERKLDQRDREIHDAMERMRSVQHMSASEGQNTALAMVEKMSQANQGYQAQMLQLEAVRRESEADRRRQEREEEADRRRQERIERQEERRMEEERRDREAARRARDAEERARQERETTEQRMRMEREEYERRRRSDQEAMEARLSLMRQEQEMLMEQTRREYDIKHKAALESNDRMPDDLLRVLLERKIDESHPPKSGLDRIVEKYLEPAMGMVEKYMATRGPQMQPGMPQLGYEGDVMVDAPMGPPVHHSPETLFGNAVNNPQPPPVAAPVIPTQQPDPANIFGPPPGFGDQVQAWGSEEPMFEGEEEEAEGYFGGEEEEEDDSPLNGSAYLQDLLPDEDEVIVG